MTSNTDHSNHLQHNNSTGIFKQLLDFIEPWTEPQHQCDDLVPNENASGTTTKAESPNSELDISKESTLKR